MALTGINHLAFITHDLEATIRFYRDLLGMTLEAGIGHDGYRHYFFRAGEAQIAFFAYEGAQPMKPKPHGAPSREPLGFDHVSLTCENREDLFAAKDKLEAAGFDVSGAVGHGTIWSIYFFDPNNTLYSNPSTSIFNNESFKLTFLKKISMELVFTK